MAFDRVLADETAAPARGHRTMDICRGVGRLLNAHGFASITEVTLANGRRADVVGVGTSGEIWIVEVKSCAVDFRSDQK